MIEKLKNAVPRQYKPIFRNIQYTLLSTYYKVIGNDSMVPSSAMSFIGDGDFEEAGLEFLDHFKKLGNLKPYHNVLDVGCGIGRMAVPLTSYLNPDATYWGLDIVKHGIKWCQNKITPKFPNFRFFHSDIYNSLYNQKGDIESDKFEFPFEDGSFDFIFLTSVFTHMLSSGVEHYLKEISRVLKPNGTCFITFFILYDESRKNIRKGLGSFPFDLENGDCVPINADDPVVAVAYNQDYLFQLFETSGLKIQEPINYGSWCGRKEYTSYQDIVVLNKST